MLTAILTSAHAQIPTPIPAPKTIQLKDLILEANSAKELSPVKKTKTKTEPTSSSPEKQKPLEERIKEVLSSSTGVGNGGDPESAQHFLNLARSVSLQSPELWKEAAQEVMAQELISADQFVDQDQPARAFEHLKTVFSVLAISRQDLIEANPELPLDSTDQALIRGLQWTMNREKMGLYGQNDSNTLLAVQWLKKIGNTFGTAQDSRSIAGQSISDLLKLFTRARKDKIAAVGNPILFLTAAQLTLQEFAATLQPSARSEYEAVAYNLASFIWFGDRTVYSDEQQATVAIEKRLRQLMQISTKIKENTP